MQQLKMRLRVICNAILDQSIHTANMSEQEALDLMMKEGFQQEGEAVAKWKRARLQFDAALHLLYRSDRTSRSARARQSESRRLVRSEEIQRQRALLRQSAGEIRGELIGL